MASSPLANPRATRELLERCGLATKHRLGQNFLVDDTVIARIIELAELDDTSRVLEVGPGIGTLTLALLAHARGVISIEADRELAPVLADLAHADARFAPLMGDALQVDAHEIQQAADRLGMAWPNRFIANLPYNVAATILLAYLADYPALEQFVVMVQAEVADRICAKPGNKIYGAYTAKLALYGHVTGRFEVAPSCFMPPPHVNSAVVRIERRIPVDPATNMPVTDEFCVATKQVIGAAFGQRRKTIRNSMRSGGFEVAELDRAFAQSGIDPRARAETLSIDDFMRVTRALGSARPA